MNSLNVTNNDFQMSVEAIEEAHRQGIPTTASLIDRHGLYFLETNLG